MLNLNNNDDISNTVNGPRLNPNLCDKMERTQYLILSTREKKNHLWGLQVLCGYI